MISDTTNYSIRDEDGTPTTVTLQKVIADVLQAELPDVHAWVQDAYNRVANRYPALGRRRKGNVVRAMSVVEARRSPRYAQALDAML